MYNLIMLLLLLHTSIFEKFHILGGPMISQSPRRFRMRRCLSDSVIARMSHCQGCTYSWSVPSAVT